jgi:hypothetical protein
MNTGQMVLTTGAIVLLGLTVLTVNRTFNSHGNIIRQTEIGVYSISLATSIIEEASGQNFDESTVDDAVTSTSLLTTSGNLGPDAGEPSAANTTNGFDDFDDYNDLLLGVGIAGVDSFTVRATVVYVDAASPDNATSTRTFHKRLDVAVTSTANPDTIKMSYVFSYFNFR